MGLNVMAGGVENPETPAAPDIARRRLRAGLLLPTSGSRRL